MSKLRNKSTEKARFKKGRIGCFGIIIISVVIGWILFGGGNKSVQVANTTTPIVKPTDIPPIPISAVDLAKAFEDNEIKANALYKDKHVQVSGKIKSIGESFGSTYIVLDSGKDFSITDIQCFFNDKTEISKIANLNKGDMATIKGSVDGKSLNVSVTECIFVNN